MKIRIQNNTLRLRLKQPEVASFQENNKVSEVLAFGPEPADQVSFTLEVADQSHISISFASNNTTIFVPQALAQEWTTTDLVGFDGKIDTGKGRIISVLVEKDFMCMDGREEDNAGSYPNPLMSSQNS